MPVGRGYKSWGSIKKEVTYGTDPGGSRDGYFRLVPPESISVDKSYYKSPGSGSRIIRGMHNGVFVCRGDLPVETNWEGGWHHLVRIGMGAYAFQASTPVAGTNTHTFSTAEDLDFFASVELSRGDIPANKVHLYTGLMVDTMEWTLEQDALLGFTAGVIAQKETPDTTRIGAPTFPAELPIKNVYYNPSYAPALAVAVGSTIATLQRASVRVNNQLELRPNLGEYTAQPLATDHREVIATLTADFEDNTHYGKFINETEGSFLLLLTGPIITGATRYTYTFTGTTSHMTGGTPPVESMGLVRIPITVQLIKSSPEFTVMVVNNQATL